MVANASKFQTQEDTVNLFLSPSQRGQNDLDNEVDCNISSESYSECSDLGENNENPISRSRSLYLTRKEP